MPERYIIQSTPVLEAALEAMRVATQRATPEDVIRDALELYYLVVTHLRDTHGRLYLDNRPVALTELECAAGRGSKPKTSPKPKLTLVKDK